MRGCRTWTYRQSPTQTYHFTFNPHTKTFTVANESSVPRYFLVQCNDTTWLNDDYFAYVCQTVLEILKHTNAPVWCMIEVPTGDTECTLTLAEQGYEPASQ